jgi:uncharacterized protein (DUF1919 family)
MNVIRKRLWEKRRDLAAAIGRRRLKNKKFTIVSNNCWGAEIYRELSLQYQTPFVGLAIFAPCYIKLLKNLEAYMSKPLTFTYNSRYSSETDNGNTSNYSYPIGLLGGDIEIHFYHYKTPDDAYEKWTRRSSRVDWDDPNSLFFKFCDHDYCNLQLISDFESLSFQNKVCFTSQCFPEFSSNVWIKECESLDHVVDGYSLYFKSKKYFDAIHWLNGNLSQSNWEFELLKRVKLV